jgi:membrane-associated phospholipid phosphatase
MRYRFGTQWRNDAVTYGIVSVLLAVFSYIYIDRELALQCQTLQDTDLHETFRWITKAGDSLPYLTGSLALYLFSRYIRLNRIVADRMLFVFVSVAASGIAVDLIKPVLGRFRPKLYFTDGLYGFDFFHLKANFVSFPSGHAATAFAVATALMYLLPKYRHLWILFAVMVAMSRVIVTAHYLSDVIMGAYIGIMTVIVLVKSEKFSAVQCVSPFQKLNKQNCRTY